MKKTTIPDPLSPLEVYYDARCGFCRRFRDWLLAQDRFVEFEFIDYRSERAMLIFPELACWRPELELVVRTARGEVIQGAGAWAVCLYACRDYRYWGKRLASPWLLPMAKCVAGLLASKRLALSDFFFGREAGEPEVSHRIGEQGEVPGFVGNENSRVKIKRPDIPDGLI
ncbi:DUF393 domain-containing protein [Verrucomicrobiaceae bacterium N1E253]|uniref:DUF393 domain-containing protein n=1 Tax=Oceaniferula marina TaxID=2748318 RepID=A0A851G9G4_9BACT|nr:DCC1-like thiol-disulfide oxidoreductase family protein [Oceaniferula marina]NWK54358.1 DUF393 domain-containing protein [Oceaniferula marina]